MFVWFIWNFWRLCDWTIRRLNISATLWIFLTYCYSNSNEYRKRDRIWGLITLLLLENILLNQILKKIFLLIDCSVSKNKMLSFDCISYFPSESFIFSTFCKVQKSNAVTFETISCWFLIHRNKPFKSWNSLKLNNM